MPRPPLPSSIRSRLLHARRAPLHALLTCLLLAGATPAAEPVFGEVRLDGGGWIAGFAQHPGGRLYGAGEDAGVFRSDDFGASWRFVQGSLTTDASALHGLAVAPADPDRVACSGNHALWTSADGGATWSRSLGDLTEIERTRGSRPLIAHPTRTDELWFAGNRRDQKGSLWRSTDFGRTWTAVGAEPFDRERATTIAISADSPDEIWVGTDSVIRKSGTGGLWCSGDGGATWRKVWDHGGAGDGPYERSVQVNSIARNAQRVSVLGTSNGIWQITATAWGDPRTYVATLRSAKREDIANVTALADDSFWASASGDHTAPVRISRDGVEWSEQAIALSAVHVPAWSTPDALPRSTGLAGRDALVQDPRDARRWLLSGAASPLLSEDGGRTWRYQPGGMAATTTWRVDFDRSNPERAYLATARGVFVVSDGGASGLTAAASAHDFGGGHWFHETMVSADGRTIVAAGFDELFERSAIIRSRDGGISWKRVWTRGLAANSDGITRAVMSPTDPDDFLVLLGSRFGHPVHFHEMEHGGMQNSPGLYRTTDGGRTFARVGGESFDDVVLGTHTQPKDAFLERDGVDPGVRYLMLRANRRPEAEGLWRSRDGGDTWTRLGPPGVGWNLSAFAVDPAIAGRLWAGGDLLRRSDDGGATWTTVEGVTGITSISAVDRRVAVLGHSGDGSPRAVRVSSDDGATWQDLTTPQQRMASAQQVIVDPWRPGQVWVAGAQSIHIVAPPTALAPVLGGKASADGATLDLGDRACARVTAIRHRPGDDAGTLVGATFEGSPDGEAWTRLATIANRTSGGWQVLPVARLDCFRFLRCRHPHGGSVPAEVEYRGLMASAPTLGEAPLPELSGFVGQALRVALPRSGFPAPIVTIVAGDLPDGLVLDGMTGVISGTPIAATSEELTIEARNQAGTARGPLRLAIVGGARLALDAPRTFVQPAGTSGTMSVTVANPGDAPLIWSIAPPASGWIRALQPAAGTLDPGASATITASIDSSGLADGARQSLELVLASNDPIHPTRSATLTLLVGQPLPPPVVEADQRVTTWAGGTLRAALHASGTPTSWTLVAGTLPAGIVLDPDGVLRGSPRAPGEWQLGVTAGNDGGISPAQTVTLVIMPPSPCTAYDFNAGQAHVEETFSSLGFLWYPWLGVGGSGGLTTDMNDRSAVLRTPAITFTSAGQTITVGVAFQARSSEGTPGGANLRVGLTRSNIPPLTARDHLSAGIDRAEGLASKLTVDARASGKSTGGAATDVATLDDKAWYRLDAVITYLGDGRFSIMERLTSLGADGTAAPSLVLTHTATVEGLLGLVGVPLHAGFRGLNCNGWGGVRAFDDFTATAPPAQP